MVVDALAVGDEFLVDALELQIDLDNFNSFWAVEVLLGHWDGYTGNTNNFYLYRSQENDRFYFIPWGVDQIFTNEHPFGTSASVAGTFATGMLARRLFLYQPTRDQYVQRVFELLSSVWNEQALVNEINRMVALIQPYVPADEVGVFPLLIQSARSFVNQRRAQLEGLLQPQPPPWNEEIREPFCFPLIGDLTVSFNTTWGTYGVADPFSTGGGTYAGSVQGAAQALSVRTVAGFDTVPEAADMAIILIVVALNDGRYLLIQAETDSALLEPGLTMAVDISPTECFLFEMNPATGNSTELIGVLGEGTLHFEQIDTINGSDVRGTLEASVYAPTF